MSIKKIEIGSLIPDDKNLNKGTKEGNALIKKSIEKFGAGRSVLIDRKGNIIAGNKTVENAEEAGITDVIVVETDGTQLVAVKRTDVDLDSDFGRELALADNATGQANLQWDNEAILRIAEEYGVNATDWGVDIQQEQETYEGVSKVAPREKDDFEEQFNSITNANCDMPIVPDFFESHECFIIPVHNSIDEGFVRDLFGLNEIYQSASGDGKKRRTNVISVEKLRELTK